MSSKFPETIDAAVDQLIAVLPNDTKAMVKIKSVDELHMSLGIWMRRHLGLWGDNIALRKACALKLWREFIDFLIAEMRAVKRHDTFDEASVILLTTKRSSREFTDDNIRTVIHSMAVAGNQTEDHVLLSYKDVDDYSTLIIQALKDRLSKIGK